MLQFSYKPKTYSSETSTSTFLQKKLYAHLFIFFYGLWGLYKKADKAQVILPK